MRTVIVGLLILVAISTLSAEETKFLRHPDYNNGRLVFSYLGDIWIYDGKSPARQLTLHPAADIYPRFSPDGKWVAFSSNRTGNWDVFIIPSEGGQPKQLTFHSGSDIVVTWTPDSKFVVFTSARDQRQTGSPFGNSLYKVSIEGGLPERLPIGVSSTGTFSPGGRFFAYNKESPSYSRKGYRGSCNREIYLYDFETKTTKRMTKNDWHDNSPMLTDKFIFFASDSDGVFNIWKMPLTGGEPIKVTSHKDDGISYPSLSSDGKTIVYEQGFGIWKLDVESGKYEKIEIDLRTDYRENPIIYENYNSALDEYCPSPDGKSVAISVHGEIFIIPLEGGRITQLTDSPARDRNPVFDPKGKRIAFISDSSGRDEVYVINTDGTNLKQITNSDTRKLEIDWSPDGKKLSIVESDHTLRIYDPETGDYTILIKHKPARPTNICWSPDGKWLSYLKCNDDLIDDVYIVSTIEKEPVEHCVIERMPYDEAYLYFTKDKLFFLSDETGEGGYALYCVPLSIQKFDPDDPEAKAKEKELKEKEKKKPSEKEDEKKEGEKPEEKKEEKLPEVKVDIEGIKKRVRKIVSLPNGISALAVSQDSSIAILVREVRGRDNVDIVYSVSVDGKELKQITSGKGIQNIMFSPDGKKLFYRVNEGLYFIPPAGGNAQRVSFNVSVKIDRAKEYAQILRECWRLMKHTFYDAGMHGTDWDAIQKKYEAVLPSVTDKEALSVLINRMLGELNASHMGMYTESPYTAKTTYETKFLGFELAPDAESGLYRVEHIYEYGPADKEWVNIKVGDYLLSIDGKPVKVPDNYWEILNHIINERVDIVVSSDPEGKEKRTSTIRLANWSDISSLRYHEWVRRNRKKVDELSNGRIGYLHIPSMGGSSLTRFKKEIIEFRLKEALIIDVRYNGGGNIDQQLIDILERRPFGRWITRDSIPHMRPWNCFWGKKLVLINEHSFSDAEIFPMAFKHLGLGKLVGVPTGGGVIATGSYSLIDGSTIRTPYIGCYTLEGINLENLGVKPDVFVENNPDDELAGKDAQLERAVAELLNELGK